MLARKRDSFQIRCLTGFAGGLNPCLYARLGPTVRAGCSLRELGGPVRGLRELGVLFAQGASSIEVVSGPDPLPVLKALVEAHAVPDHTGTRETIFYLHYMGGAELQHHALPEVGIPGVDDAVLEDLHRAGYLDIEYGKNTWRLTPTPAGRAVVEQHDRIMTAEPAADLQSILDAVANQAQASNKLAWPAVRPVLEALRDYWEAGGYSRHGIQFTAVLKQIPEEQADLFRATVRALTAGSYLEPITDFEVNDIPAEAVLTEKAHAVLDGWPGAAPDDLGENLLAVLLAAAEAESDPARKQRFKRLAETVREVGVSTAGEVLAKVLMGGV